jgi:uncharacterized protein
MVNNMAEIGLIFIDTSFIIAYFNKRDKYHKQARNIIQKSLEKSPNLLFTLSDYVFDELMTLLKIKNINSTIISKIGEQIIKSSLWRIIQLDEEVFNRTWQMFNKYHDKEWSFTDTSSFALMETLNITYYLSYDHHFAQFPKIQQWEYVKKIK